MNFQDNKVGDFLKTLSLVIGVFAELGALGISISMGEISEEGWIFFTVIIMVRQSRQSGVA